MWKTKTFKTAEELAAWIDANADKVQYEIIYVNNGYGVTYRPLRRIA